MKRLQIISLLLYIGVVFYLLGAIIHFFGLSVYPWFVSELHSAYHDTLIAISSLVMAFFFFQGARHPSAKPLINAIITAGFVGGVLIIAMGTFVDFTMYHAVDKGPQAIFEGILALGLSISLIVLRKAKR